MSNAVASRNDWEYELPSEMRFTPNKPKKNKLGPTQSFVRVFRINEQAVAKCRTGRAAALYLAILRETQSEYFNSLIHRREPNRLVRPPMAKLGAIGLRDPQVLHRATRELIELGLIVKIDRPGFRNMLAILTAPAEDTQTSAQKQGQDAA